jgi:hypothetical protein
LDFFESELNSLRKVGEEQHEQLKMIFEIARAHEARFGQLDSDYRLFNIQLKKHQHHKVEMRRKQFRRW